MKRRLLLLPLLALAFAAAPGVSSASAASCGSYAMNAPFLGSGIHAAGTSNCSVQWGESADELLYESGGTWHDATTGGNPIAPQLDGPHAAGLAGFNFDWTGVDQTPYCSFNWKINVTSRKWSDLSFISGTSHTSPTLFKTC